MYINTTIEAMIPRLQTNIESELKINASSNTGLLM